MRKIADIRKDLSAAIAEARLIDASKAENAEALKKALDKIDDLTAELNAANRVEAAEQALAAQRFPTRRRRRVRGSLSSSSSASASTDSSPVSRLRQPLKVPRSTRGSVSPLRAA